MSMLIFRAATCWLAPINPATILETSGSRYLLVIRRSGRPAVVNIGSSITTRQVAARVASIDTLLDINTQERRTTDTLKLNDIARVKINVQQALAADAYDHNRSTGAFYSDRRSHPSNCGCGE